MHGMDKNAAVPSEGGNAQIKINDERDFKGVIEINKKVSFGQRVIDRLVEITIFRLLFVALMVPNVSVLVKHFHSVIMVLVFADNVRVIDGSQMLNVSFRVEREASSDLDSQMNLDVKLFKGNYVIHRMHYVLLNVVPMISSNFRADFKRLVHHVAGVKEMAN